MEKLLFKTDFLFSPFWFAHNKELFAGVTALPSFCPIFCWNFIGEDILLKLYWWRYFVETSLVKIFGWNFIVKIFRLHRPTCATHFTSPGHWQGSLKIIVNPIFADYYLNFRGFGECCSCSFGTQVHFQHQFFLYQVSLELPSNTF